MTHHYGRPLQVHVENGELVIAIGIQTLAHAASYADWANPYDEAKDDYLRTFAITDAQEFAKDVTRMMLHEREDGSTPLSDFLDAMMAAAVDDGSMACEYEQSIKHGETAPSEAWADVSSRPAEHDVSGVYHTELTAEQMSAERVNVGPAESHPDFCSAPWAPMQMHSWVNDKCAHCGAIKQHD